MKTESRGSAPVTAAGARSARTKQWQVLRQRDYALLFWGQMISSIGTEMQVVAISWQVYLLTHSAVALGLIGLFEAVPRLTFSLVGGVFADLLDRRKLLLLVESILAAMSTLLALCTHFGVINAPLIYIIVLISASAFAFEFPTRQAIIPSLVPRQQMADAVSLSKVMMQLAFLVGPLLGGFALGWLGIAPIYWINVFSFLVVIGSLLLMHVPRVPDEMRPRSGLGALREGLDFLRAHPVILAALSLDFVANLFGSPKALLPVYASAILHTGPQGLGILSAAIPIGAVALTPLTGRIGRLARQGLGIVLAIIAWGICIIVFGLLPGPLWLSVLFLAGAGAADMVSVILRAVLIQFTTPDEFRGRVNAVNGMFATGGPMLGQFESGIVAGLFTPQISVASGGIACILATLAIVALVPKLVRMKIQDI